MLDPVKIRVGKYTFIYKPLTLTPARKLYSEVFQKFGPTIAAFIEAFEVPEKISLEDNADVLISSVTKSLGGAIYTFVDALDHVWLGETMTQVILPNLTYEKTPGDVTPGEAFHEWYENEFGAQCDLEIELFIECLKIQYSNFFARIAKASTMIETIRKNIKNFTFPQV